MPGGQPNHGWQLLSSLIARWWVGLQTLWRFRLKVLSIDEMVGAWYFGCLSAHRGSPVGFLLLRYSGFFYCWVLIFASSPSYIFICVFCEMMHWKVRGLSCKPNIYVSWSTSELRVRLALNRFKPSSKIFDWPFLGCTSFVDFLSFFLSCVCYAFVSVCLYVPCGHLLGKRWPLCSRLRCPTVNLSLSNRYSGSGVVLGCIDSWSLHPYILLFILTTFPCIWRMYRCNQWLKGMHRI